MNWKKIDNSVRKQPTKGVYTDWKQQIADDCHNQCVYCSIGESLWGGIDHYHIDHFRPKSKAEFEHLKHIITNLYYSCPICNRFKQDDWPNEPVDLEQLCYPDPCEHDYKSLFDLDLSTFALNGLYGSSKYLINRLYLNRPQLVYERRELFLKLKAEAIIADALKAIEQSSDLLLVKQASALVGKLTQHLLIRSTIKPYKLAEIRKP